MPRHRLGVAVLVPGRAAAEVDGLRRALGDGSLGRIVPHVTLVPPVNMPAGRLGDALAVLREAATAVGPLRLTLGPVTTFHPVTPVVYLAVGGDVDGLRRLRDGVFRPPLERTLTHPFVPHVTLADDMAPERIPSAVAALADAALDVTVDRVHLLREEAGRVWRPIADVPLAPQTVVGRGGLPLELTVSGVADPEAAALLGDTGDGLVVVARRDGLVVGAAHGWTGAGVTQLVGLVVAEGERRQGVGGRLLAAVEAEARVRGSEAVEALAPDTPGASALLAGAGWRRAADDGGTGAGPGPHRWRRVLVTGPD
jgi:2'-5' RNA ligase